jgi:hypothetical protein
MHYAMLYDMPVGKKLYRNYYDIDQTIAMYVLVHFSFSRNTEYHEYIHVCVF